MSSRYYERGSPCLRQLVMDGQDCVDNRRGAGTHGHRNVESQWRKRLPEGLLGQTCPERLLCDVVFDSAKALFCDAMLRALRLGGLSPH